MTEPSGALAHLSSRIPKFSATLRDFDQRTAHYSALLSPNDVRRKQSSYIGPQQQLALTNSGTLTPRPSSNPSNSSVVAHSTDRVDSSPHKRKRDDSDTECDRPPPLRLKYRARSKFEVHYDGEAQTALAELANDLTCARGYIRVDKTQLLENRSETTREPAAGALRDILRSFERIDRLLEDSGRLCETAAFQMLRLGQFHEESRRIQRNFDIILERCEHHIGQPAEDTKPSADAAPTSSADVLEREKSNMKPASTSPQREVPPMPGDPPQPPLVETSTPPSLSHSLPSTSHPSRNHNRGHEGIRPMSIVVDQGSKADQIHALPSERPADKTIVASEPDSENDDEEFFTKLPPVRLTSKMRH